MAYELSCQNVKKIYIANRTPEKAEAIAKVFAGAYGGSGGGNRYRRRSLDRAAEDCELFANLTPLGMKGFPYQHDYLGFIDRLPGTATVFDCIINPPESETIAAAKKNGLNTVPGMYMLVAQMDVIFDFLFQKKITQADKEACIEELCSYWAWRSRPELLQ